MATLTTKPNTAPLATLANADAFGDTLDAAATVYEFQEYKATRSANTLRAQRNALRLFGKFVDALLAQATEGTDTDNPLACTDFFGSLECWQGMRWGYVKAFAKHLLDSGYSIATVNASLAAVRKYADFAALAGYIDTDTLAKIKLVKGYSVKAGARINENRDVTRIGSKKPEPVKIATWQIEKLINSQPDTIEGRRDALIVALFAFLGVRVSELHLMDLEKIDRDALAIEFYRPKVDKWQTHSLTESETLQGAVTRFLEVAPMTGALICSLQGKGKARKMTQKRMSIRGLNYRLGYLAAGTVDGLTPHDLRHTWATNAANSGTPLDVLKDAGGWASYAMPLRYIQAAEIANKGVKTS